MRVHDSPPRRGLGPPPPRAPSSGTARPADRFDREPALDPQAPVIRAGLRGRPGLFDRALATVAKAVSRVFSPAARRAAEFVGRIADGALSALVGAARNVRESARTFGAGAADLLRGNLLAGLAKAGRAVVQLVQTPVDALLMAGGAVVSAVQTALGVEPRSRTLTPRELGLLQQVFGDSVDYGRIRIKEGDAGVLTVGNRPFTHGDTLYIPEDWLPMSDSLLVHEVAHVWQHQRGGTDYMSESLYAQYFGDGYDYGKALREGKGWDELNPEQQAEIVEKAFERGLFSDPGARFVVDGVDYTGRVWAMLAELRAGRGAP